jgi:lipopolysaccharide transport protein LptA
VKRLKLNFILSFFIVFLLFDEVFAEPKSNLGTSKSPTRIRSDIIDIKRKSQVINFLKNVVVEKDNSSLLAQKMTVIYVNDSNDKSEIKKIEAFGDVKIFSEEFIASGEYGFYDPNKSIFVLEKNVIVNNGTSIASGNKFIYDIQTKKGNFVGKKDETSITGNGGDKRVIVVIGDDLKDQKKSRNKNGK